MFCATFLQVTLKEIIELILFNILIIIYFFQINGHNKTQMCFIFAIILQS